MCDDAVWASGARAIVAEVEGEVIAVDMATWPCGGWQLCHADCPRRWGGEIGDTIIADYVASIEAEVRAPTAEEEANP